MLKTEKWLNHEIRFVEINGEWWAVAKDIADALDYSQTHAMTKLLNEKYFISSKLEGMNMKSTLINEHGIYKAIFRSNKPEAEAFEDWVIDVVKQLRESTGLEGFQVFRMMDKEHQKKAMSKLKTGLPCAGQKHYVKANTIANKAVSTRHGHPKMVKKAEMSPQMLIDRQPVIDDTVQLMVANEYFNIGLKVSDKIYEKHT